MNAQPTNIQALMSKTAVKWLLLSNVILFPFGLIVSNWGPIPGDFRSIGLIPFVFMEQLNSGSFLSCIAALIRHQFFHLNISHLFMNVLFLVAAGVSLESVLGCKRFLLLYFASGTVAATAFVLFAPDMVIPLIGASGAIAGLLGASLVLTGDQPLIPIFNCIVRSKHLFTLWLIAQFCLLSQSLGNPVAGQMVVHIAGLATGFAIAAFWKDSLIVES